MDTYSWLRQFADSWALLALVIFFIGVVVWVLRPGSRRIHDDAAQAPFRHEKPAKPDDAEDAGDEDRNG